jgi:hypothetical protein
MDAVLPQVSMFGSSGLPPRVSAFAYVRQSASVQRDAPLHPHGLEWQIAREIRRFNEKHIARQRFEHALCGAANDKTPGGVGFYSSSDFVHIDTGNVRFW